MRAAPNPGQERIYAFGRFQLLPEQRLLTRGGAPVHLTPQILDLLVTLVEHAGQVLSHETLIRQLWGDDSIATENNLATCIWMLRNVLGRDVNFVQSVPRKGYRFRGDVVQVVERQGEAHAEAEESLQLRDRSPAHAREAATPSGLERLSSGPGEAVPDATPARPGWRYLAVGLVLAGCVLAAVVGSNRKVAEGPPPLHGRRVVAMLGFENLSGWPETAWLSTALVEMLAAELGSDARLRIVPGETVERLKVDLRVPTPGGLSPESLARIRDASGADIVVAGSIVASSPDARLLVNLSAFDTHSGEAVLVAQRTGTTATVIDLASSLGGELRSSLGGEPRLPAAEAASARAESPQRPEAQRLYAEALAKLRGYDALGARELLDRALAIEPSFPLAHAALAESWKALGHNGRAAEEASKALALAGNLPRQLRLRIEATLHAAKEEWPKAVEPLQALWNLFPDDPEHGLALVEALISAGRAKEAEAVLSALRALPPPTSQDPRIDLAEAALASSLSDYRREATAAARAAGTAANLGRSALVAEARYWQAMAHEQLGETAPALELAAEAVAGFARVDNAAGQARALNVKGRVLAARGDGAGAAAAFEAGLKIARRSGAQQIVARLLSNLGFVARHEGRMAEATSYFAESADVSTSLGDDFTGACTKLNRASAELVDGDLAGAEALHREALDVFRRSGAASWIVTSLSDLTILQFIRGDLAAAEASATSALETARRSRGPCEVVQALTVGLHVEVARGRLGSAVEHSREADAISAASECGMMLPYLRFAQADLLRAQDRLAEARSALELNHRRGLEMAFDEDVTAAALVLARIAVEMGDPEAGERWAREAASGFEKLGSRPGKGEALSLLALASVGRRAPAEALSFAEQAERILRDTQEVTTRLTVMIDTGRLFAALGRPEEAQEHFQAVAGEAARIGDVPLRLAADLALGEHELAVGRVNEGRARLSSLKREAEGIGFAQVARRAGEALGRSGR